MMSFTTYQYIPDEGTSMDLQIVKSVSDDKLLDKIKEKSAECKKILLSLDESPSHDYIFHFIGVGAPFSANDQLLAEY